MALACNFYLLYFSKIICYYNFLKFLSFVHMIFKQNILSNYTMYSKELVLYYMLSSFIILKFLYLRGLPAYLEKIISSSERDCLVSKG